MMIYILPELFILLMSLAILMIGVFSKHGAPRLSLYLTQITLFIALLMTSYFLNTPVIHAFYSLFILDQIAVVLKIFILTAMIFTFWYSHSYNKTNAIPANEFYVLGLLSTVGMMILVSSSNLMTLFLGLELMSLPIYAMVALQREKMRCVEAAMKYFIMGSIASGLL